MSEKRFGGHVLRDGRWVPADLAEDGAPSVSMSNTKAELLAAAEAAGVDADESMTKAEILKALES